MSSKRQPPLVLIACLMLCSCSTLPPPVIVPHRPLPAALMIPCPPPVAMTAASADAALLALRDMYDLYGLCGGRLLELQQYLEEPDGG